MLAFSLKTLPPPRRASPRNPTAPPPPPTSATNFTWGGQHLASLRSRRRDPATSTTRLSQKSNCASSSTDLCHQLHLGRPAPPSAPVTSLAARWTAATWKRGKGTLVSHRRKSFPKKRITAFTPSHNRSSKVNCGDVEKGKGTLVSHKWNSLPKNKEISFCFCLNKYGNDKKCNYSAPPQPLPPTSETTAHDEASAALSSSHNPSDKVDCGNVEKRERNIGLSQEEVFPQKTKRSISVFRLNKDSNKRNANAPPPPPPAPTSVTTAHEEAIAALNSCHNPRSKVDCGDM